MNAGESVSPEILVVGPDADLLESVTNALPGTIRHFPFNNVEGAEDVRQHVETGQIAGVVVKTAAEFRDWDRIVEDLSEPRAPPVVVLATDETERERAVRVGASDVFVRPLGDTEVTILRRRLNDLVRAAAVRAEYEEKTNLLEHIFNQVPSALYVKDEEGRHIRKRNFENDPQEYFGKTDLDLYPDEFGTKTHADDMRVIEEGARIINKEEYNPHTGEWTLTSKVPWRGEEGDIQGLIGVSRLITEKKEYEEQLRLRNRAMEAAPIGITIHDVTDEARSIRFANEGVEELTGYDRSAVEGGTLHLFEGPETDVDQLAALDRAFAAEETASIVTPLYRRDRTPFWAHASIAPVTDDDGKTTHFVGFLQDVTGTKEHEETIERRLDEFGDLLSQQLRPPLRDAQEALDSIPEGATDEELATLEESIRRVDTLVGEFADVNSFDVKSKGITEALSEQSEE